MTKLLSGSGPQRRILLVEDDAMILRSIVRLLRRRFEVDTAATAEDAIAMIADDPYAVVTDHDLGPSLDGRHVLAEARRRAPNATRILTSGEPRTPGQGEDGLWHAFLLKPVSREGLFLALGIRPSK